MDGVEINTLGELMRAVQDTITGGYYCDVKVSPRTERTEITVGPPSDVRHFFLVVTVETNDPAPFGIGGEYWFFGGDAIMQVL